MTSTPEPKSAENFEKNIGMSSSQFEHYPSVLIPLVFMFISAMLAFSFAKLGSEVLEGDTRFFDMQVLRYAQTLRLDHPWLAEVMRDLSGLGSTVVLTLIAVASIGYLVLFSSWKTGLLVALSATTGTAFVSVFKAAFGRIRPELAYAEFLVPSLSFPSGHASMSAIVFFTLGTLIASTRRSRAQRAYILASAGLVTALVGLSRVALGVHWATDVIGGWAFGTGWAIVWLLLARHIARRA
jgi:undecaprenyl-diphosphatase